MGLITKTVKVKWNQKTKQHYEKLGYVYTRIGEEFEVKVEDLPKGSVVKVQCVCDGCGEVLPPWRYQSYNRSVKEDGKTYCNKCAKKLYGAENTRKTKLKNGKSFYDWCIENNRQDVLDRWDYELNDCSPKDISYKSNKMRWFKCPLSMGHKSEEKRISDITSGHLKHSNCKQCNSIGQYIIDKYRKDFLWKIWNNKNKKSPFEYSFSSHVKVWWNCPDGKHEPYQRSCKSSKNYEFRCPTCMNERNESILEECVRLCLSELGYDVLTEHNCTIKPINPKTKQPLPFDNEIILSNGKHLIIEVHGIQHYKINGYYNKTKEDLEYQQYKDKYKKDYCIQMGHEYLEIPYTAFDKKETYKKLINNKIKEILDK